MTIAVTVDTQVISSEINQTQTNVIVHESPVSVSVVDESINVVVNEQELNVVVETPTVNITLEQTPINVAYINSSPVSAPVSKSFSYAGGKLTSVTSNGQTETFTYNEDDSLATATERGYLKTFIYVDGVLSSINVTS